MGVEVEAAAADRKYHDKEEFVTGHNGTTPYEIFLMCCVIPIGLQLYYKLYNYHAFFLQQQQQQQQQGQSMGASNNKGTILIPNRVHTFSYEQRIGISGTC
jgi:hypothetical protein